MWLAYASPIYVFHLGYLFFFTWYLDTSSIWLALPISLTGILRLKSYDLNAFLCGKKGEV